MSKRTKHAPVEVPACYKFGQRQRVTKRGQFLHEMNLIVPWKELLAVVAPKYHKSGQVGRPPIGLERMLRMYFLQQWFNLADEALEDAIYESQSMREFLALDLTIEAVPDSTTLLKFRHLLEAHGLTAQLFQCIRNHLEEHKLLLREGTLVDATIIAAPSSTKNEQKARDPEMHQTKKGNQWYFGLKAHIGTDAKSGLVHSVHVTAANESDVAHAHEVLHGQESEVFADAGYLGLEKRPEIEEAQKNGHLKKDIDWHIALRRNAIEKITDEALKELYRAYERTKAQIRARVEHPFHVVKNLFHHRKVRYKGDAE